MSRSRSFAFAIGHLSARMRLVLFAMISTGFSQTFTTNFDGTENPLSENGAWSHVGLDWKLVQKRNGIAYGTQTGSGGYDDSYAHLTGFPADQSVSAVIQRTPGSSGNHEVELLLRWKDTAHSARGYECLMPYNDQSYTPQIVRWNGPLGNFTYLVYDSRRVACKTGDVFSASITGNRIIAYLNGVELMRATDSAYTTGNPGIGFYREANGADSDMAFTSFTATGAGTPVVPRAPVTLPTRPERSLNSAKSLILGASSFQLLYWGNTGQTRLYDLSGRAIKVEVSCQNPKGCTRSNHPR
jgi:hypothetical protein